MTSASPDISLRTAKLAALFAALVAVCYAVAGAEPSPRVELFLAGGPLLAVVFWLQKDAGRTGVGAVQDWGYFLLLAWPIVIPWYALKTRGRAGWSVILGLYFLIGAAYLAWGVVSALRMLLSKSGASAGAY